MTRLASLLSGVCEVLNAIAVRAEDVIGEWVDNLGPRPATSNQDELHRARELLSRWNDDALIEWNGEGYFSEINSKRRGGWVFGVSNGTVSRLIDDTHAFFRGVAEARR